MLLIHRDKRTYNLVNLPTEKIPHQLEALIYDIQDILRDQAYDFMLISATAIYEIRISFII